MSQFEQINERVVEIGVMNDNLCKALSVNELATAMNRMSDNIDSILDVSQSNKHEAEVSSEVAGELEERSEELKNTADHLIGLVKGLRKAA